MCTALVAGEVEEVLVATGGVVAKRERIVFSCRYEGVETAFFCSGGNGDVEVGEVLQCATRHSVFQRESVVRFVVFEFKHVFGCGSFGAIAGSSEGRRKREVALSTTASGVREVNPTAVDGLVESLDRIVVAGFVGSGVHCAYRIIGSFAVGYSECFDVGFGLLLSVKLRAGRGREEREDKCGKIMFFHTP